MASSSMTNRITRRRFLRTTAAAVTSGAVSSTASSLAKEARDRGLNVLILMTDEQHHRSLSCTGNPYIQTPNMDRIAREGATFTKATCVTPFCSPSRASMLTGVYPFRHKIFKNVTRRGGAQPPLQQEAFANTETILHGQGYACRHRGKWHLGDKGDFDCYDSFAYASEQARGYGRFLEEHLPATQFANHPSPGRYQGRPVEMIPETEKAYREFRSQPNNPLSYIATIGRSVIPPELLPETRITNQVLGLIDEHADAPFMITASWSPPHDLWVIPDPYYSMVDRDAIELPGSLDMPEWDLRGPSKRLGDLAGEKVVREFAAIYHGMVKYIDDQLGRVLRRLDERGLTERTLVLFTSDHGDMVGAHGCIGKSITSIYDDLLRIPLLMRLPGRIRPGTVVDRPVSQIDFMPTILDYLGHDIPNGIHGRSMRGLIEGRDVAWRDHAFCQRGEHIHMLRTDRYKFFHRPNSRLAALYDLKNDPNENHNLCADPSHTATIREMQKRLATVMADGVLS